MMAAEQSIQVFPDREALSHGVAARLVDMLETTLAGTDWATLALAGGRTPRRLYELLADTYRHRVPWHRLLLFWGDERLVPPDHPASNYRMAHHALLQHVPLLPDHLFPMPTQAPSAQAGADAYEATLHQRFGTVPPAFDLTLLGLGDDGHTASLFPENVPHQTLASGTPQRWVEAVTAPPRYEIRPRLTLTLPALNASRHVFFLVSGASKRDVLHRVLHDPGTTLPAAYVEAQETLTWFVDEAAYGKD